MKTSTLVSLLKGLAFVVLIAGIIVGILSPVMLLSSLVSALMSFAVLYSVGEALSLLSQTRDAVINAANAQQSSSETLKRLLLERESVPNRACEPKPNVPIEPTPAAEKSSNESSFANNNFEISDRKYDPANDIVTPIFVDERNVKCPACGKLQRPGRYLCYNCGIKFQDDANS